MGWDHRHRLLCRLETKVEVAEEEEVLGTNLTRRLMRRDRDKDRGRDRDRGRQLLVPGGCMEEEGGGKSSGLPDDARLFIHTLIQRNRITPMPHAINSHWQHCKRAP